MSLTVRHINADSTFLLVFHPDENPKPEDLTSANGAYHVLIDPFITGNSIVLAPWFAITTHVQPASISHLSDIEEPDVVIISQNKPDHCHKSTLLQLNPAGKTLFAAEPGAAKAMKSWKYFDPNRIYGLDKYNPKERFGNSLRLRIPPLSQDGHAGELNISFIPAKSYATGLHNAFGITYVAPTRHRSLASVSTVDLPRKTRYFHMPMGPSTLPSSSPPPPSPGAHRPKTSYSSSLVYSQNYEDLGAIGPYQHVQAQGSRSALSRHSNTASSEFLPLRPKAIRPPSSYGTSSNSSREQLDMGFTFDTPEPEDFRFTETLPTPPDSPYTSPSTSVSYPRDVRPISIRHESRAHSFTESQAASFHRESRALSLNCDIQSLPHQRSLSNPSSPVTPGRPKTLSVVYTPHGLPVADLQPYIQNHLVNTSAMPLTLLLHGFDHVQNPWYLGGNVMMGVASGVQIARALMARCWVCAHDENKDDRGLAVLKLKTKRTTAEQVRRELWRGKEGEWLRKKGWNCDVRNLPNGSEMFIGPSRDLLSGMEGKRESRLLKFSPVSI